MKRVAILAMHGVVPADLATPCEIFGRVRLPGGAPGYQVEVCGVARRVRSAAFAIVPSAQLCNVGGAHTLIVPGTDDPAAAVSPSVLSAVRAAYANGTRIASVCTGAFVLAAAGLLDGRRATTHWLAAPALAERYPSVRVDPDVLFVDEGQIVTSAGASAALDMCLHLVRRDYGHAVAMEAARHAVAPLDRDGGQAQFIHHEIPEAAASLASLLDWMQIHAAAPLRLEDLARRAKTSTRTLMRRFKQQVGVSPLQWLLTARTRRAQALLEATDLSLDEVAAQSGFDGISTFRERFRRIVGVSPSRYRATFNVGGGSGSS